MENRWERREGLGPAGRGIGEGVVEMERRKGTWAVWKGHLVKLVEKLDRGTNSEGGDATYQGGKAGGGNFLSGSNSVLCFEHVRFKMPIRDPRGDVPGSAAEDTSSMLRVNRIHRSKLLKAMGPG